MILNFLGAAGTVTGSRTLVSVEGQRLLVDCGMFQGYKQNRLRNWSPLGIPNPDAVLLTHAHIDHSGWLPALVRGGFHGPVYCTSATADLLRILLMDAARIQEEDAEYHNREGSSRHAPALPLYTEADAAKALSLLRPQSFGAPLALGGVEASFQLAGHILGASSLRLSSEAASVLFSGDLGRADDAVVPAPASPPAVDALVLESTYGDRLHERVDVQTRLAEVVNRTVERGGMVLIPAFAVGRAQSLLWALHCLMEAGRVPRLPIVVDSPMASSATEVFLRHPDVLRLSGDQLRAMTDRVRFVRSAQESKELNALTEPMILISASGMLTGGRVLHHIANRAPVVRNTLLFVGFQAPGTRGGRVLQGERVMKIYGRKYKLRCEIASIGGLSAHADADELVAWLGAAEAPPRRVLLNHGEPESLDALRRRLCELGYRAEVATEREPVDLSGIRDAPRPEVAASPEARQARESAEALLRDELGIEALLRYAPALEFSEEGPGGVAAVRAALAARQAGRLPASMILRVRSEGLRRALQEALPEDQLAELSIG